MLSTNTEFLQAELMDVMRLYGEDVPDAVHVFSHANGEFFNAVEIGGKRYEFRERQECAGALEYKRYAKRFAKLALYETLSERLHTELPWGALTGIRPTRLAYQELAAGRDFLPLFEQMHVGAENAALVGRVIAEQKPYYERKEGNCDLFVSLPFCPTKCEYCSFITAPIAATRKYLPDYLAALGRELAAAQPLIENLRSVYVGGGTPFAPEAKELARVLAAIAPLRTNGCEYTVEAGRPDTFTREKLDVCKEFGVTRICINAQSFSDATLARIGRNHTADDILRAYEMSRKFDFSVNFDLIAGLTGESIEEFCDSVDRAVALSPENITVHTLCLKKGAKLREETCFLAGGGISEMIAYSRRRLYEAGYVPYYMYRQKYMAGNCENTGWTKPGKACVYNVDVMEEISDNIACGANAVGKKLFLTENRIERIGSPKDIPTYIAKTEELIAQKRALFSGK